MTETPRRDPSRRRQPDPRRDAGERAERQMKHYLHRAFAADADLHLIHNLRLVDPDQPEPDGSPGVAQIDHLLIHRNGAFIVESKSVHDELTIRSDGSGGDEWTRRYKGKDHGFPSPIQQARRQAEFLRKFLQVHREQLLGIAPVGTRMLMKLMEGTTQRGFRNMPIQIIVAVSDEGKITRVKGWREPTEPFRTFVTKADLVPDKIRAEWATHKAASLLSQKSTGDYGVWRMKDEEAGAVAQFLNAHNTAPSKPSEEPTPETPRATAVVGRAPKHTAAQTNAPTREAAAEHPPKAERPAPAERPAAAEGEPACKNCGGRNLSARSGRYGYYWSCNDCNTNTAMPTVCACGAVGRGGSPVRIRKTGPKFERVCETCGMEKVVWTER